MKYIQHLTLHQAGAETAIVMQTRSPTVAVVSQQCYINTGYGYI